jgi:hypothetical protein
LRIESTIIDIKAVQFALNEMSVECLLIKI